MVVTIGRISATCPACGHYSFHSRTKHPRVMDILVCRKCGSKASYRQLLDQVKNMSIDATEKALADARARRRPAP